MQTFALKMFFNYLSITKVIIFSKFNQVYLQLKIENDCGFTLRNIQF